AWATKATGTLGRAETRLDWEALGHLFTSQGTPRDRSIVAGIRKAEPAHVLIAAPDGAPRIRRYWDATFDPDYTLTETTAAERLHELLEESGRLHLISDVPLGGFLIGGVDSSA